jgi:hypothetical protein
MAKLTHNGAEDAAVLVESAHSEAPTKRQRACGGGEQRACLADVVPAFQVGRGWRGARGLSVRMRVVGGTGVAWLRLLTCLRCSGPRTACRTLGYNQVSGARWCVTRRSAPRRTHTDLSARPRPAPRGVPGADPAAARLRPLRGRHSAEVHSKCGRSGWKLRLISCDHRRRPAVLHSTICVK